MGGGTQTVGRKLLREAELRACLCGPGAIADARRAILTRFGNFRASAEIQDWLTRVTLIERA